MVFDAAGPNYFSSHGGVPDDGTRSCPIGADCSEYCYGGGPYNYESGLADRFANVVHAGDQPLWNSCTQSQLGVVVELMLPIGHTLLEDYYSTKKLIKDLGLPVEKIGARKNECMLYWKNDVDLEYCKFCGDARYKPTRGRVPCRKKSPYAVLRYLLFTSRLQRLYSSRSTAGHMT
ncbi:UNVERIFIED_CONTAM: hypothetical protein Sradi_3173600 [Sesamum radiatum]|uniref:Uncharacterized protein n=1 Tax=Sesamum radiatum TaxID=300843 RepID=A0AAW2RF75_SESRA